MSFAVRSLRVAENGASQPLTSAPREPLEVSDVTRSSVTLSWLASTSNDGATIMAYVFERPENLSPTRTHVARVRPQTDANLAEKTDYHFRVGAENVEGTGPPLTLVAAAQSLCTMPAVTCFVSAKDNFASQIPVTFTSLIVMSSA